MKVLNLIACGLLALACGCAGVTERSARVYDIPRLSGIVIDGQTDDWGGDGFRVEMLVPDDGVLRPAADLDARIRLAWNDKGLLLLAAVRDDAGAESPSQAGLRTTDSVQVYLSPKRGSPERCHWSVAPGRTPSRPKLRSQLRDGRTAPALKKLPAEVTAARAKTDKGYVLEALYPWAALAIRPEAGREVAVQIIVKDADPGDGPARSLLWHPASDTYKNPRSMMRIRLGGKPSPAIEVRLLGRYDFDGLRTRLTAMARARWAGKTARVRISDEVRASGVLKATGGGWASAEIDLPLPPPGRPYGPITLSCPGTNADTLRLPDADRQRADILRRVGPVARPCVFHGRNLPEVRFAQPFYARALLGPHKLKTTYYDRDYKAVTSAERPGRYAAVAEVVAPGGWVYRRVLTLFRLPGPVRWWREKLTATVELPEALEIKPHALTVHRESVSQYLKWEMVSDFGRDDDAAKLLAGLQETKADAKPAVERTSVRARDNRWRVGLKRKLNLINTRYLLFLPADYEANPKKIWPLVLFLHGRGQRGYDVDVVKAHGPPRLAAAGRPFPFILVAPQCPPTRSWLPAELGALLDKMQKDFRVDADRVYCTGLSMGGYGTWALACEYPDRFAAIAPICGGGDPRDAARIKHIPTWVFHGRRDTAVPVGRSLKMVKAIRQAGGSPTLTIYRDKGHDSWTVTYDNEQFYRWLLANRRGKPLVMPVTTQPAR